MSDDDLWDVAWKESWLSLAQDAPGGEVNDEVAFNKARELWAGWMMERKKLEQEREADKDGGLPVLPVSSPTGSPTRGQDGTPPTSPMRASAPEFMPNTATPLLPGQKKDRTFFQDWLATQSPNLLEPDFMQGAGGMGVPSFPGMMPGGLGMGFLGWPGRETGAVDPKVQAPPSGKPGLLGDGASYFLLEPQQAEAPQDGSVQKKDALPEAEAFRPAVPREEVTQGWLPPQFAWVDPFEDESCPPPPSLFELQLPPNRTFTRSPKASRLVRLDGLNSAVSLDQLRGLAAAFGGVQELFALGHSKKQTSMRVYIGYDTEAKAGAMKKALHQKTHEYGVEPLTVTFGVLKEKKDPHDRAAKAAKDRKSRKAQPPRQAVPNNHPSMPNDTSWKAMWSQMPGAGTNLPAYPGDFTFPNFPYPANFLEGHGQPQPTDAQ